MHILSLVITTFVLALPAAATLSVQNADQNTSSVTPLPQSVTQNTSTTSVSNGNSSGRFIVKIKDEGSTSDVLSILGPSVQSTSEKQWNVINAITGTFDESTLDQLRKSSSVEVVEEDIQVKIADTQLYTPWGLERVSSRDCIPKGNASALSYTYSYDESAGTGVDIYVIDTGINIHHSQFCGRATWGATFGKGLPDFDDHGHGTHVSGTAAGYQFGVAKNASLIAVKVINGAGSGYTSDIISGLNFVYEQAQLTQRPSVVSMSLGSHKHDILNTVVDVLAKDGIHVVVSAGNGAEDANNTSPASAKGAITVGATNITDEMAFYSNFGKNVLVFAPGTNVISAWNTDDQAIEVISGTSMAAPHVSGAVASIITLEGNMSPPHMKKRLQDLAVKDALKGVPHGTDNYLLQLPRKLRRGN